jgi:3-oxoadipate enol-lactonase
MIGGTFAARFPDRIGSAVLMNGTATVAPGFQKLQFTLLLGPARVLRGIRAA